VLIKTIDGKKCEPIEHLTINTPEVSAGKVIELVTQRRGDIVSITSHADRSHIEFEIPSRGLIGLRNNLLTATEGEAIIAHRFKEYQPWKGSFGVQRQGALIAMETGTSTAYAINKRQDRGRFFIDPNDDVYAGQVIGEHIRQDDLVINVTEGKKLTNMRASGSDDKVSITPAIKFSLEEAMEYIANDEYLEITPISLRMRKILLSELDRKRAGKND
jgi:GTP-binding protein